jgi:hypothetical protein
VNFLCSEGGGKKPFRFHSLMAKRAKACRQAFRRHRRAAKKAMMKGAWSGICSSRLSSQDAECIDEQAQLHCLRLVIRERMTLVFPVPLMRSFPGFAIFELPQFRQGAGGAGLYTFGGKGCGLSARMLPGLPMRGFAFCALAAPPRVNTVIITTKMILSR